MSLPAILGTTMATVPADVPYVCADAKTISEWRPMVARAIDRDIPDAENGHESAPTFRIGIAWQGNRANKVDRWRSFPLVHFAQLARIPGVRLISLQKGDGRDQIDALTGEFPVAELTHPRHGGDDRRDLLDTAAIISHLDLVITPDTALAHLAGALGARVFVALPAVSEWRWLIDRENSPWYPTMRLFRQEAPGDWDRVFERIAGVIGLSANGQPARSSRLRCDRQRRA
jgi:hypothetical protein